MIAAKLMLIPIVGILLFGAFAWGSHAVPVEARTPRPLPAGAKDVYVAGGCFWCLDGMYTQLKGVLSVESGYAGGSRAGVSYEEVSSGTTGHAETVRVIYDPNKISERDILRIFFTIHDPTTLNRQGPDYGTQYRSAIFVRTPDERLLAEGVRNEITKDRVWKDPIVTSIEPLKNYTPAEEYHQDYLNKFEHASEAERLNMNIGYCTAVVEPHVLEFRKRFSALLKKN